MLSGCSGLDTFIITVDYATTPKSLSLRAVSSLGECLAICKAAKDCQATNFYSVRSSTSPICELLASKQVDGLGVDGNATSSVFKMYYAERICLPVGKCIGEQGSGTPFSIFFQTVTSVTAGHGPSRRSLRRYSKISRACLALSWTPGRTYRLRNA